MFLRPCDCGILAALHQGRGREPRRGFSAQRGGWGARWNFQGSAWVLPTGPSLAAWKSLHRSSLFFSRFRARRKASCTPRAWHARLGMCAAGGWGPGTQSSASSTPPTSSLCSLLQVDSTVATACLLLRSLCCLQLSRRPKCRQEGLWQRHGLCLTWTPTCLTSDRVCSCLPCVTVCHILSPFHREPSLCLHLRTSRWSCLGPSCGQGHLGGVGVLSDVVYGCRSLRSVVSVHVWGLPEVWNSSAFCEMPETFF